MIELPTCDPDWVTLDTECSGLYPDDGATVACVAIAWMEQGAVRSLALPFDQGERDKFPSLQLDFFAQEDPNLTKGIWRRFLDWLLRRNRRLVFHNAKYDLTMMRVGTRHWPGVDFLDHFHWDTMVAARVLEPKELAGLDVMARRHNCGQKDGKEELQAWLKRRRYPKGRYDLVPWDITRPYVTADAEMTARLYQMQLNTIYRERLHRREAQIQREFELLGVLYRMEERGIGYNHAKSIEAAELLEQRADEIEQRMPFKCTPAEAADWFFRKQALPPRKVSERTGRPSLDEEQVREWIHDGVQWAYEYTMVTRARRAVSMWFRGYPEKAGADGRLRCNFKQTAVKSGRMSVERIQLQALPKSDKYKVVGEEENLPVFEGIPGVRELVLPRDGYGVWSLDLSQAELRVASKYSRCQKMLERLLEGGDVHGDVTEQVLHVERSAPNFKTQRDIAKRVNFGGIFMVGGRKLQETLAKLANIHLPLAECERIVRGWRNMYPEFVWAYRQAMIASGERGYVRLLRNTEYEIRSYFLDRELWWDNRLQMRVASSAWNRVVQGSLAEAFKLLMAGVERQWPGFLILTVHDAVELEMPLSEGAAIAREVAEYGGRLMTDLFEIEMKMDIDIMALPEGVTEEEVPA